MDDIIIKTIDKYYRKNELSDFLTKCKKDFIIPEEVKEFVEDNNILITDMNYGDIWPSSRIIFEYEKYIKGEFEVSYSSTLMISKLAPVFYLQHEFQVDNKDLNSTTPILDGFDTQPYNIKQQELEVLIKNYFLKHEFIELSYSKMNEVLCGLEFKQEVTLLGSQVTVEHALFFDILDICPD